MDRLEGLLSTTRPWLADGGLETDLVFHEGQDLPLFSAFVLLDTEPGRALLARYFDRYLDLAGAAGQGFALDTVTWRANMGWAPKLGLDEAQVRAVNRSAVALARDLREARDWADRIAINGIVGPAGDGYAPEHLFAPKEAAELHAPQLEAFAEAAVDLVTAMTITHPGEAIGIVRRARALGLPVAISFTVETDGRLPTGQRLPDAIAEVEAATGGAALYFGINCAHPTHFIDILGGDWTRRIGLVRANASKLSHAELDEATVLDDGDPEDFGAQYRQLADLLPGLRVVGGCCGTDHRHVAAVMAGD